MLGIYNFVESLSFLFVGILLGARRFLWLAFVSPVAKAVYLILPPAEVGGGQLGQPAASPVRAPNSGRQHVARGKQHYVRTYAYLRYTHTLRLSALGVSKLDRRRTLTRSPGALSR